MNNVTKSNQRFERNFTISEQYDIWHNDGDRRADIEDYIREQQHITLGREIFKQIPSDRKLYFKWHESIVSVYPDQPRHKLVKTYKMTTSIVITEIK